MALVDDWIQAANLTAGKVFRRVTRTGRPSNQTWHVPVSFGSRSRDFPAHKRSIPPSEGGQQLHSQLRAVFPAFEPLTLGSAEVCQKGRGRGASIATATVVPSCHAVRCTLQLAPSASLAVDRNDATGAAAEGTSEQESLEPRRRSDSAYSGGKRSGLRREADQRSG
jgi:hypothetical protein